MKGTRSTLVMLLVLLTLGAYVYFVELDRLPASETPPNERLFASFEPDDIQSLIIRGSEGDTSLERRPGDDTLGVAWHLTAPVETRADEVEVSTVASSLSSVEIRRVVEEGSVTDLEPFGLASPAVEVSFSVDGDESMQTLLLGDASPTGADRYAKLADDDRIFLVEEGLQSSFDKSTFRLRDKSILDIDTTGVDTLRVETAESAVGFSKVDNEWQLIEPWEARADFSAVESLVGRLGTGEVLSFTAEAADAPGPDGGAQADAYGLDTPSVTVTLGGDAVSASLLVGNSAGNGGRHARDASRAVVFTIDEALVTDLQQGPGAFRRKDLFSFRSFNATRLEIEQSGEAIVFEKEATAADGDADDDSVSGADTGDEVWVQTAPERLVVEPSDMDDLLSKVSNLRADSFIESRADGGLTEDSILSIIQVTYRDDDSDIEEHVVFWRRGEDTHAVHGDEPGAGVVNSRSVDDANDSLQQVRQLVQKSDEP